MAECPYCHAEWMSSNIEPQPQPTPTNSILDPPPIVPFFLIFTHLPVFAWKWLTDGRTLVALYYDNNPTICQIVCVDTKCYSYKLSQIDDTEVDRSKVNSLIGIMRDVITVVFRIIQSTGSRVTAVDGVSCNGNVIGLRCLPLTAPQTVNYSMLWC